MRVEGGTGTGREDKWTGTGREEGKGRGMCGLLVLCCRVRPSILELQMLWLEFCIIWHEVAVA